MYEQYMYSTMYEYVQWFWLLSAWCHFLNIFASKESHKNKGQVSQIFGQSVTNDTSTPGWEPLATGLSLFS